MEQHTTKPQPFNELIQGDMPVLVDFHAEWCGPCKAMNPVIQDVARELKGRARVIKIDIDKSEAAAIQYNVSAVPTFILFRKGKTVWRHSGMIDKQSLIHTIASNT